MNNNLRLYLEMLRLRQWIKNIFIFAGILFSQSFFKPNLLIKSLFAFFIFCLLSGSAYIFNDLIDLKHDRRHPVKSKRPLASGRIKVIYAVLFLVVILSFSLGAAYCLNLSFFLAASGYLLLQLTYSLLLKYLVIIDVFTIACGFVFRVVAGAVVIDVQPSYWMLICTMFLALFLGLVKRRCELTRLKSDAPNYRKVLGEYNIYLLDHMISIIAALTILYYIFYTSFEQTARRFAAGNLIFTIPFVVYGILRYLFLVYQKEINTDPEDILISDKPLMINIFLWVLTVGLILCG